MATDFQHHMFILTFDSKLFLSPIPKTQQPIRVLDAGTGTGVWAIDFGGGTHLPVRTC